MLMNSIEKNFAWYLKNQDALVKEYEGKYLVINDEQVAGAFDHELEAYEYGSSKFEAGTFLIQPCLPGSESYTQTFYSRAII